MDTFKLVNRILNRFHLTLTEDEFKEHHFYKEIDYYNLHYTLVPFFDAVQYFLTIFEYDGERIIKLYRNLNDSGLDMLSDNQVFFTETFDRIEITDLIAECIVALFPAESYEKQYEILSEVMKNCFKVIDNFKDPREKIIKESLKEEDIKILPAGFTDYYNDFPEDVEEIEWVNSLNDAREGLYDILLGFVETTVSLNAYVSEELMNTEFTDFNEYRTEINRICRILDWECETVKVVRTSENLMFIPKRYHKDLYLNDLIEKSIVEESYNEI